MFIAAIVSTQDIEATQVSVNKWADKEDVVEEGDSRGRGHMYTYGWFMLMFDRKQQNSVKQLSFN